MTPTLETASQQAQALRRKEISARELLAWYLERVHRLNPQLNAVVALDEERAAARADELDQLAARGQWVGPLHGLPCTIKDALDTAGLVTTGGAPELADRVPEIDAAAVGRARAAGAVIFGKTNLPRWSGDLQTSGGHYGRTNNPWDLGRTPGGSSGGAAAAVAAGLTSFEIGTDIGGSIRVPSTLCGVAGHKPTFGVVPQRGYVAHLGGGSTLADVNVVGPIARSVADLELLLGVLAGPDDWDDGWSFELPEPAPGPWRVAVHLDEPDFPIAAAVRAAIGDAADALRAGGSQVAEEALPVPLEEAHELFFSLVGAAMALSRVDSLESEAVDAVGGSHGRWLRNDLARVAQQRSWRAWFADHDVLLVPAWPTAAPPHSDVPLEARLLRIDDTELPTMRVDGWLGAIGVVGLPATVVRVGTSPEGLPLGLQVVAGPGRDRTALAVAAELERRLGGYQVPPLAS